MSFLSTFLQKKEVIFPCFVRLPNQLLFTDAKPARIIKNDRNRPAPAFKMQL